jgi:hypothetical protein
MIDQRHNRMLRLAAAASIVSLVLMVWSLLQPTPIPVVVAMSVGQAIGTLALVLFLYVIVADFRAKAKDTPK